MGRHVENGWIILRTGGARTLPLVASLRAGGIEAWSPAQMLVRRVGKARDRREQQVPILPTFVFARAQHLAELVRCRVLPSNPHPAFSIFRHAGRAPVIASRDIAALQDVEFAAAARWQYERTEELRRAEHDRLRDEERLLAQQAHVERERQRALRRALKATAPSYHPGSKVSVPRPEFAGMSGEVIETKGRAAMVSFGGGRAVKIDAWLLVPDTLQEHPIAA